MRGRVRLAGVLIGALLLLTARPGWCEKAGLRTELKRHAPSGGLLLYVTVQNLDDHTLEDLRVTEAEIRVGKQAYLTDSPVPVIIGSLEKGKSDTVSVRFPDLSAPGQEIVAAVIVVIGKKGRIEGSFRLRTPPR